MPLEPAVSMLSLGSLHETVSSMDERSRWATVQSCVTRACVSLVWTRTALIVAEATTAARVLTRALASLRNMSFAANYFRRTEVKCIKNGTLARL